MARKRRLSPNELAEAKASVTGLKSIAGYKPQNADFSVAAIEAVESELDALTAQESDLLVRLGAVRDHLADKGTDLSQKLKGAAQQVIAQFGDDSMELQALGRKRASERGTRRPKTTA